MRITEIKKIDGKRFCLYVDEAPFSSVYASDIRRMKLVEDKDISENVLKEFRKEYLYKRAMNCAVASLQYSEKCEQDIRKKLSEYFFDSAIIDETVEKLKKYGYLDDVRYACCFIKQYAEKKSQKMITCQLLSKGVKQSVIDEAFATVQIPEENICLKNGMMKRYGLRDIREKREKVFAFYIRKGYSYHMIKQCVEELLLSEYCTSEVENCE